MIQLQPSMGRRGESGKRSNLTRKPGNRGTKMGAGCERVVVGRDAAGNGA
jgi:hypothetical protein